jgi:hypothetical protein
MQTKLTRLRECGEKALLVRPSRCRYPIILGCVGRFADSIARALLLLQSSLKDMGVV